MAAPVAGARATSRHSPQSSGERAVSSVRLRQHAESSCIEHGRWYRAFRRWFQAPLGSVREKALDVRVVLFRLERARAVDEQTARRNKRRTRSQYLTLQG